MGNDVLFGRNRIFAPRPGESLAVAGAAYVVVLYRAGPPSNPAPVNNASTLPGRTGEAGNAVPIHTALPLLKVEGIDGRSLPIPTGANYRCPLNKTPALTCLRLLPAGLLA